MKVLLYGGEGFIGQTVKEKLKARDCVVRTFDVVGSADERASVTDFQRVRSAIERFDPDRVANLAGLVGVPACTKDPQKAFQVNVVGAWNVALACSLLNKPLVHVSSTSAYGSTATRRVTVTEDDECIPQSMYGYSKYMGENAVRALCIDSGLSCIMIRPSSVYGKNQREQNVVQVFIDRASRKMPITIHGDGKQTKCFTYVEDVGDALTKVLLSEWKVGKGEWRCYNVSSGRTWNLLDLVRILERHFGKVEFAFESSRKGDFSEAVYSIERIQRDYQFNPRYSLDKAIEEILEGIPSRKAPPN